MMVVADAGPLRYLVLIEHPDVLSRLYDRVLVPQIVVDELTQAGTPVSVQSWITQAPAWVEVRASPSSDPELGLIDPGRAGSHCARPRGERRPCTAGGLGRA